MPNTLYLVHMPGTIEAHPYGPFASEEEREAKAIELVDENSDLVGPDEEDMLMWMDLAPDGTPTTDFYTRREIAQFRLRTHPEEARWLRPLIDEDADDEGAEDE